MISYAVADTVLDKTFLAPTGRFRIDYYGLDLLQQLLG